MVSLEFAAHARFLGIKCLLTVHSIFNNNNVCSLLREIGKYSYKSIDRFICVSHACKADLILGTETDPSLIHVIPNGLDYDRFTPDPTKAPDFRKKIVVICSSRLENRKGIDLLVEIIPLICNKFSHVNFIVVGNGTKKYKLEDMVKQTALNKRVRLKNGVPYDQVRNELVQGHIFLNTSWTESFGMSNVEALSCGLYVVTTNVGGIKEVLPEELVTTCELSRDSLVEGLSSAIENFKEESAKRHERARSMYSWDKVAVCIEKVYRKVLAEPRLSFYDFIDSYPSDNYLTKISSVFVYFIELFMVWIFDLIYPREKVEKAVSYSLDNKSKCS